MKAYISICKEVEVEVSDKYMALAYAVDKNKPFSEDLEYLADELEAEIKNKLNVFTPDEVKLDDHNCSFLSIVAIDDPHIIVLDY